MPLLGDVIDGRYEITRALGEGGVGTVYEARDLEVDNRRVALKVLKPDKVDAMHFARFKREAELAAAADRQGGVVKVHDLGLHNGAPYLVMELVDGCAMDELLADAPLAPERIGGLVGSLARTLVSIHEDGIVHRDIKPGNVLVGADGQPKLADFGLARGEESQRLTRTGAFMGTPHYMAPEQFTSASTVDGRADIYSLGVILYQGLTGELPCDGNIQRLMAYAMSDELPPLPTELQPEIPRDIEAVCMRAIAKEPEERYASAGLLADDLVRAFRGERISASSAGGRLPRFIRRVKRRDPTAIAGLFALTSMAILFVSVLILVALRLGPGADARAALQEQRGWARDMLDRNALGLGDGPAPAIEELEQRASGLSSASVHLDADREVEARALAVRLRAYVRLAKHRQGVEADASPPSSPTDALIDCLLQSEGGDPKGALRAVDRVVDRADAPPEGPHVRAHVWGRVLEQSLDARTGKAFLRFFGGLPPGSRERRLAAPHAQRAIAGWYAELSRAAAKATGSEQVRSQLPGFHKDVNAALSKGQVESVLPAAKRDGLELSAPAWEEAAKKLRVGSGEARTLRLLERCAALVTSEPRVRPGPELSGVLDRIVDRHLDALDAVRTGTAQEQRLALQAVRVEAAIFRGIDSSRPLSRRFQLRLHAMLGSASALVNSAFNKEISAEVVLSFMRIDARPDPEKPLFPAQELVPFLAREDVHALRARYTTSRAARLLVVLWAKGRQDELAQLDELITTTQEAIDGGDDDLGEAFLGEAYWALAELVNLKIRETEAQSERVQLIHRMQVAALEARERLDPERTSVRDTFDREAEGYLLLAKHEEIARVWREAVGFYRQVIEHVRAQGLDPFSYNEDLRQVLCNLALKLNELGRKEEARERVREAEALEPDGGDEATSTIETYLSTWAK